MAFTLRLGIHGVAMHVERGKESSVLLCALGDVVKNPTTYVRFDKRHYRNSRQRQLHGSHPTDPRRHIVLDGERIWVDAPKIASEHQKLTVNWNEDPFSSTPTAVDEYSLRWLPHLEKLEPGFGKINRGYFKTPAAPPKGKPPLVARVDFSQGYLRTNGVERVQVPFKRDKADRPELRPIARELVLELKVEGDHVVLRSEPLDGSKRDPKKDMRFDANGEETIDIVIGNEARRDIYWETPPIVPIDVIGKDAAKEYRFYYQLCERTPQTPLLPFVAARPSGGTFCSVGNGG